MRSSHIVVFASALTWLNGSALSYKPQRRPGWRQLLWPSRPHPTLELHHPPSRRSSGQTKCYGIKVAALGYSPNGERWRGGVLQGARSWLEEERRWL
ncbi:hypothetical protein HC891_26090 [Candidatus Gracilibacteria bacterium]|nr:hypothetical protein [Candidatus Gracilibacteria bacterium]